MYKLFRFTGTLLLVIWQLGIAHAQGVNGAINGQITDVAGRTVSDTTVRISDPRTGLTRSVQSDNYGNFWFSLPPGNYELKTEKRGFETNLVQVLVRLGATVEVKVHVVEVLIEEIEVVGTRLAVLRRATGETGLNISLIQLAQVPVPRSIEAVALLAPGTVPGIAEFGDDKTLVSFGGASVAENVYYIDGLNVTNFRNGLGGASVPFEFYDQFQIKTGGYSAEFGRSTGGVLNARTRRGGNEFEFGIVSYVEPAALRATTSNTLRADRSVYDLNSDNTESNSTTDLYFSGPIIKDRLFFFVLYEPQNTESTYNQLEAAERQVVESISDDFWGGNLTWNINDRHSLSFTAFSDERAIIQDLYNYSVDDRSRADFIGTATEFRGGRNYILHYDGNLTEKFVVSAQFGSNEYNLTNRSTTDVGCPVIVDVSDSQTNLFPGCWINAFAGTGLDKRSAYRIDVKYRIGKHFLRAGFDRENNLSSDSLFYSGLSFAPDLPGGIYYRYESWDVGDVLINGAVVPDINGDGSRVDTVRRRYLSLGGKFDTVSEAWYVEDKWVPNDRWTIEIGIRNEAYQNNNSDGDAFIKIDEQWAPRLAVSWKSGGVAGHRATVNWGRYYLPIAAHTNVQLAGGLYDEFRYFVYDGERDPETAAPTALGADGIPTTQELGSVAVRFDGSVPDVRSLIDHSIKPIYQDEWIVSYQREFGDAWVAGVRYVYRDLKSTIDDVATFDGLAAIGFPPEAINFEQPCSYVLTNPGTDTLTYCDSNGDGVLEETFIPADAMGQPAAKRTYEAVEITAQKKFNNRWTVHGSYTWSKNLGNTEGSVKSDNGQPDAGITEDFDFPQLMDGAYGYLPNDRRHKLKLWGTLRATDQLLLSANLLVQSGRPVNSFGQSHPDGMPFYGSTFYLEQPDGSFEFVPRGTAGRTDWVTQLNLAAIYSFRWGESAEVELRADVFNALNSEAQTEVYEHIEQQPDQFLLPKQYQQPRYLRIGASIRF